MSLVDSHCHIDGPEFSEDFAGVLDRSSVAGVKAMLCVGTGDVLQGEVERAVNVARANPHVYAAVGVHPHDASTYSDLVEERLCELADDPKVVAWGEIGLDYHYDNSPRDIQRDVFERQLVMAIEKDLPVIIHTRDAEEDTIRLLESFRGESRLRGVMHCFGGSLSGARAYMDLGFLISFAGNVTFKKAEALREVAKSVPVECMLVETDCPFMSPEPLRGRRNEPSHLVHTASVLASLHSMGTDELGRITTRNFEKLFGVSVD